MAEAVFGRWRGLFRQQRPQEATVLEADITAFGEELARYDFVPVDQGTAALAFADYERALDAYERAKRKLVGDHGRSNQKAEAAALALEEGRHALACAQARAAGMPLPKLQLPCFFDPRHGPSVTRVSWKPPEGEPRPIDVCAADAVRLGENRPPIATGGPLGWGPDRAQPKDQSAEPVGRSAAPASGGRRHPYRIWPPGTPVAQCAEGQGEGKARLRRPEPGQPVLLVVRLDGPGRVDLPGFPASRSVKAGSSLRRMIVPLPADGGEHIGVRIRTSGPWRAWLHPPQHIPVLESRLNSRGPYVFRYTGGPATLMLRQHGSGTLRLHELTEAFETGLPLFTGNGTCNGQARLTGPTLIRVRSSGNWHLTLQ
ncbi:hypothetical protein [Streptomyces anulatus]|uniref:hypothetical protein n=1 Tax=Streptomyces anulatus TaxID=1892 RepID=UPI0036DA092E